MCQLSPAPRCLTHALEYLENAKRADARKRVVENVSTAPSTAARLLNDSVKDTRTAVRLREDFCEVAAIALATDTHGNLNQSKYTAYTDLPESALRRLTHDAVGNTKQGDRNA